MRKFVSFICLVSLLGSLGCNQSTPAPVDQPDVVAPETPAADDHAAYEAPPAGRFVQADPKLATLKAKFVFGGEAPSREKVDASKDPFCAQTGVLSHGLIVGKNGGLQNLALILDAKRSKAEIPESQASAPSATLQLDNNKCEFVPHVLFARPGQTIEVLNSDPVGHNANFSFFNNQAVNFLIPAGGKKDLKLSADEPAPIPVECNIHPWMKAYLIVQDHPYVGISDADGVLEIANLPVGEVTFRVWHESADGSIDEGDVGGEKQKWSRGRMELELKPGVNDLGTITIAADKFKK